MKTENHSIRFCCRDIWQVSAVSIGLKGTARNRNHMDTNACPQVLGKISSGTAATLKDQGHGTNSL
jgi:hypothetical protein